MVDTALIHHLRDISLLYLSTTSHPSTSGSGSGFISVSNQISPPQSRITNTDDHPASTSSSAENSNGSNGTTSSFIHVPHPHLRRQNSNATIGTGSQAVGSSSHGVGVKAAYLSAGDLDGDDMSEGWGGERWWVGVGSEGIEEVREGIRDLEGLISGGNLTGGELAVSDLDQSGPAKLIRIVCQTHTGISLSRSGITQ